MSKLLREQVLRPDMAKPRVPIGNAVAMIAKPVAVMLDKTFGTNIRNCSGCETRRKALNNLIT